MKSKPSKILKDLRAQRELSQLAIRESKHFTRFDAVGQRDLAQCDASNARGAGFDQ
jgi:hypothetical protein